jgi:hypothetical protein
MSDEQRGEDAPEEAAPKPKTTGRDQVPAHVPPHMRDLFTKHEGAIADRPGFRNKSNTKSKAQRKKRKK